MQLSDQTPAVLSAVLLQLFGLLFFVGFDKYIGKRHRGIMLMIVALEFSLVAQNFFEFLLCNYFKMIELRLYVSSYGYLVRPLLLVLFICFVSPGKKHIISWILAGFNTVIYLINLFVPISYFITINNHFESKALSKVCIFISILLLVILFYFTVREYGSTKKNEWLIPALIASIIVVGIIADIFLNYKKQAVDFLTIAVISCSVFYYIWLHIRFVRQHEKDLITEQRLQIMMTQIKPHFLYNSLGAIEALCDSDPKAAKDATVKFSRYLRGNMDSISAEGLIDFEKELAHTKLYLELEKLRFEDALEIRYDISCTDFKTPVLTLEPLVENAVRHGVRKNEDGVGYVAVSTREYSDRYEINVTDNGPGFDVTAVLDDGNSHIGIENVRSRLKAVCSGKLQINSVPGQGTTATIIIPKGR